MTLAPVQLLPAASARVGATVKAVTFDEAACAGCRQVPICSKRGNAITFLITRVVGKPLHCKKIDADLVACAAKHMDVMDEAPPSRPAKVKPVWLCDANVFINAYRWNWPECRAFVSRIGDHYDVAITEQIHGELLGFGIELPFPVRIIACGAFDPKIIEAGSRLPNGKHVSDADLSLVQALLEHPEFAGIISADRDVHALHPPSIVRQITGREVATYSPSRFVTGRPQLFGRVKVHQTEL